MKKNRDNFQPTMATRKINRRFKRNIILNEKNVKVLDLGRNKVYK